MDSTSSMDPDLARWLHRLPLAERLEIQRREEQMAGHVAFPRTRCPCCGGRISAGQVLDFLRRCTVCRDANRDPPRRFRQRRDKGPYRPR